MSEWKKVKLKDCCHSISDGDHLPPPKSDSGVPFVTIANIDATNHIDFGNTMFVPYEYYNNLNDIRKAKFNDILYSVVGSFGKPVLIKENKPFAFQRHIAILRPNKLIVDSRFLYYVMLSRDFYMQADTVAIGAAQRTISLTALRNMEVELPSMEIQHRIANILSRYDSLIENYQKQIKLLEEAAQRLYKEWFVDLHFPGHENTKIVDGVPEGWEKKKISDICQTVGGGTPSTKVAEYYDDGNIKWVTPTDITRSNCLCLFDTDKKITEDGLLYKSPTFNWAISSLGTIGKLLDGDVKAVPKPCKPKKGETYWYYRIKRGDAFLTTWCSDGLDLCRWKAGNCFKTREEAETKGKEIMKQIQKEYEEN